MISKESMSRMTLDIPEECHKRLKALAALRGESMRKIVLEWICDQLYGHHSPNKDTLLAIEKVEKGKDIVECKDVNDLCNKLGI